MFVQLKYYPTITVTQITICPTNNRVQLYFVRNVLATTSRNVYLAYHPISPQLHCSLRCRSSNKWRVDRQYTWQTTWCLTPLWNTKSSSSVTFQILRFNLLRLLSPKTVPSNTAIHTPFYYFKNSNLYGTCHLVC